MLINVLRLATITVVSLLVWGCSETSTNPVDDDDQELVTTLIVTLHPPGGGTPISAVWEDIDGVGGNPPNRIDTIAVDPHTLYSMTIDVFNRSVQPEEDLTPEIVAEGTQHQFFFSLNGVSATVAYNDSDANGLPIGQKSLMQTLEDSDGSITIELSHFDDPSTKDGVNISNETDIAVTLPIVVQD